MNEVRTLIKETPKKLFLLLPCQITARRWLSKNQEANFQQSWICLHFDLEFQPPYYEEQMFISKLPTPCYFWYSSQKELRHVIPPSITVISFYIPPTMNMYSNFFICLPTLAIFSFVFFLVSWWV